MKRIVLALVLPITMTACKSPVAPELEPGDPNKATYALATD